MQKTKEINIGGKRYTIKELLVRDVWELFAGIDWVAPADTNDGETIKGKIIELKEQIATLLEKCADIKLEELLNLYPSEIETLVDSIMEVNSSFFGLGDRIGLQRMMANLKPALLQELNARFALWLREAIKMSGDTVIASSSAQSSQ